MAYQSLYRKYRPQRFGDLVGQEHVTGALRNAVRDGRIGHAYLFSGPRGTGKTSTARILAKALNCTALTAEGEPCGECENCVAIAAGRFLDIRELDAASNRGIDNIRDVIDSTALGLGPSSRSKLYVLDEVHMLTEPASNALLKTLEEAPEHVVFVLATTNPEKVLPTLRSRTQHFEFSLMPADLIGDLLSDVCAREGVTADPEALATIATAAGGSARDALSLLDQALAHGPDALQAEAVAALFGGSPFVLRLRILEAIAGEDAAGALVALGEAFDAGQEPRRLAEDLLGAARDAFLLSAGAGKVRVDAPAEDQEQLASIGESLGNAALVRVVETLGQSVTDMRGQDAADPRLVLEVAIVRLSRRDAGPPLQTVLERIERLERAVAEGGGGAGAPPHPAGSARPPAGASPRATIGALRGAKAAPPDAPPPPAAAPSAPAAAPSAPAAATESAPQAPPEAPSTESAPQPPAPAMPEATPRAAVGGHEPIDIDDVVVAWSAILEELPVATRSAAQAAQPLRIDDGDVLVFGVSPAMLEAARPRFKKEADAIRAALTARFGRSLKFSLVAAEEFSLSGAARADADAPADAGVAEAPPVDDEPEHVDVTGATDAGPADDPAGVGLLREQLGATVVEELSRDADG